MPFRETLCRNASGKGDCIVIAVEPLTVSGAFTIRFYAPEHHRLAATDVPVELEPAYGLSFASEGAATRTAAIIVEDHLFRGYRVCPTEE